MSCSDSALLRFWFIDQIDDAVVSEKFLFSIVPVLRYKRDREELNLRKLSTIFKQNIWVNRTIAKFCNCLLCLISKKKLQISFSVSLSFVMSDIRINPSHIRLSQNASGWINNFKFTFCFGYFPNRFVFPS